MKTKKIVILFIFTHILAGMMFTSIANAGNSCRAEINAIFEHLPLGEKTLKKVSIIDLLEHGRGGSNITGFEGWFSFDQCKGSLVIVVDSGCFEQTIYTRGNCEIRGIKNY